MAVLVIFYEGLRNTILGIIIGYFIGNIMYNFFIQFIFIDPLLLYWIVVFLFIIIVVIYSAIVEKQIVVFATALLGSYAALRGLSIILGGFPDEGYTSKLIGYGEFNELGRIFSGVAMLYLLGIIVLFIVGCCFQGAISPDGKIKEGDTEDKKDGETGEKKAGGEGEGEGEKKPEGEGEGEKKPEGEGEGQGEGEKKPEEEGEKAE